VHAHEEEVANQVDNTLSFCLEQLPQPLRERADMPDDVCKPESDASIWSG
jgi:hypothetical protein